MAVIEQNGLLKYIDENGNVYLLYPITKKDNVEGLDEIEEAINALEGRKINGKTLSADINLSATDVSAAPAYTYGTEDMTAGTSALETGKLYFVYE